jgi:hypothetical protein
MFRGFIRDVLVLYLCFHLLLAWPEKLGTDVLIVAVMLFLLTIWFLLERLGILEKY